MVLTKENLDDLVQKAKESPRLRMNMDLRTSLADQSQRMMNALEPGTIVPIHRHRKSTETVAVLRGKVRQIFYDNDGNFTESVVIEAAGPCAFYVVPQGVWHTTECLDSGTIIFEAKEGIYEPFDPIDILELL